MRKYMPFALRLPFLEGEEEDENRGNRPPPLKIASPSRVRLPNSQRAYVYEIFYFSLRVRTSKQLRS